MIAAVADEDVLTVRAIAQRRNPIGIAFEFWNSETA